MSMLTKVLHELCPDEPAAANNHNLHAESPRTAGRRSRTHSGLMRDCDDATPVRDNGSSRANGANGANGANRGAKPQERRREPEVRRRDRRLRKVTKLRAPALQNGWIAGFSIVPSNSGI